MTFFLFTLSIPVRAQTPADVERFLTYNDYKFCEKLGVDPMVPIAIAGVETDWTPFVVRVNTSKVVKVRAKGIKQVARNVFVCSSKELCTALAYLLIRKGFKNLDLGAFQLNYYHQKKRDRNFTPFDAFDVRKAYRIVCTLVASNFKVEGRTANAVALYHSARPRENYRYARKFWRIYLKLKGER